MVLDAIAPLLGLFQFCLSFGMVDSRKEGESGNDTKDWAVKLAVACFMAEF